MSVCRSERDKPLVGNFEEADKAYGVLRNSLGDDSKVMNNMGYSYLIRGNLVEAKRHLYASFAADPASGVTSNNLKMISDATARLEQLKVQ